MSAKQASSSGIDEYIKTFPKDVRLALESVRESISQVAPDAVEAFAYQMPTFKLNGKNLVHFAAWKEHIGFYPTPSGIAAFAKELAQYKRAKGSVQFPLDRPMPLALIAKIVKYRAKEMAQKKLDKLAKK